MLFLLSNILFSSGAFVFAFVKYEHDLGALHFFQDSSGDPCPENSTSLGSGDSGAEDDDFSEASESSAADADAVHSEWRSAQHTFTSPADQFHSSEGLSELFQDHDACWNRQEFPHLRNQISKGVMRPRTISEMPENHERIWEMVDENSEHIDHNIDIGPTLLKAALSPKFWLEVLAICYGNTLTVTGEQLPLTKDQLTLMEEPKNPEDPSEETEGPDNRVFFYRAGKQAIFVSVGITKYRWLNRRAESTGNMSRLWLLVMRFQPNPPWLSQSDGTYVRLSYRETGDQTGSDDDSELEPDSGKCPVEYFTESQLDDMYPHWRDFHEEFAFYPPDARGPSTLRLNCDGGDELWRCIKGFERPGTYIRTKNGPVIEVGISGCDENPKIESSVSLCTALQDGKFELHVSGTLTIDGHSAKIVDWLNNEVHNMHERKYFDSAYEPHPVFRTFQRILEQVVHEAKWGQVEYKQVFANNWVSLRMGSNPREVEGTYVIPYSSGRDGMIFRCSMRETIDGLLVISVSSAEVGTSQSCFQQVTPADGLRFGMIGSEGISKLRGAVQTISKGASKKEEFNILIETTNDGVVEVDTRRKHPASPKPDDEGDPRNLKGILKAVVSAETGPVQVTITRQARTKLLSDSSICGVSQDIQFTAKSSQGGQEFIFDILRVFIESKKRRGHVNWMRFIKPNEVHLTIAVRSGDASSWPMEPEHKVGGVKDILDLFLRQNDIYVGQEYELLHTFTNGGNVQLTALSYSHWERCFHLQRLKTLDNHILAFVRYLILITGGSPLGCELQRCKGQGKLYWTGEFKGEGGVQDKRVEVAMNSENSRCFGGETEQVEQPFINLKIRVDLISDIPVSQVIFCNRCSLHKLNLNGLVSRICRMKVSNLNRRATRAKPLNRQMRYLSFTRPYFSQSLVWVWILSCGLVVIMNLVRVPRTHEG